MNICLYDYYLPLKNDIITLIACFLNCGYNDDGKAYCKLGKVLLLIMILF